MISINDAPNTIDLGDFYAILPSDRSVHKIYDDLNVSYKNLDLDFNYNSGDNETFLTPEQIQDLIQKNVDKNFIP